MQAFIAAVQAFLNQSAEVFDLPVLEWIQANLTSPAMDKAMPIITLFGEAGIFWIALSLLFIFLPKTRRTGWGMAIALAMGVVICNIIMKPMIGRIRPYDYQMQYFGKEISLLIKAQHDFSFPSGHTIASFEACTVLMLYKKRLGIPATLLAIAIAFSRLYLYVHYPTDVLVSVVLGTLFGVIGFYAAKLIPLKKGKYEADI